MGWRPLRWTVIGIGALLLLGGGASIFRTPRREILYRTGSPLVACVSNGCLVSYTLEVGNTGLVEQDNVKVHLRADALDHTVIPTKVLNFGKVPRPVEISDEAGIRTYDLGSLAVGARVEIQIPFHVPHRDDAPRWPDILVGIEAPGTTAAPGDPASTGLMRLLFAVFG